MALVSPRNRSTRRGEEDEKNEAAAATNVEAKKRFAEGNERYSRGDYDGAVESFKAAIAADPKLPGPYRNLGLAYRALSRCNDAVADVREVSRAQARVALHRSRAARDRFVPRQARAGAAAGASQTHTVTGTPHAAEAQAILHVAANLIGGEATDEATVESTAWSAARRR